MPFVKRDAQGKLIAVSLEPAAGFDEELDYAAGELAAFLRGGGAGPSLADTDRDFIRVLEDVVDLLINKGVFLFTELPESAQRKILQRQYLRRVAGESLDLLEED